MRSTVVRTPGWLKIIGTIMIIVLPLLVVSRLGPFIHSNASPVGYALLFLVVGAAAQLGLVLRWWGRLNVVRLLFDMGLVVVGGVLVWAVSYVAYQRGGGLVDPALVAVIMAYLVAIWSGQHPS